jgi:DNA-binding CsgD family transcriptional regulator
MLPAEDNSQECAALLGWLARTRFLRGRFRDAVKDGEQALIAAVAAGDSRAEGDVLNTLGMAQIALGQVDQGVQRLRRAQEIARGNDDTDGLAVAYSNLADLLNLRGRTLDALETAREGLAALPWRPGRSPGWIMLTLSELEFEVGDWPAARAHLESAPSRVVGVLLIFRKLREADLALGEGDEDLAQRCLAEVEPLVATSSEPQWIGMLGTLLGELRRRRRDLAGARSAVAQALDRLELCTDDVMRIARVTAVGIRVEADFAQRARDLREKADERDALARARIHMQRLRSAAQDGGPVEGAWRTTGDAELARARGRNDPALWLKAAAAWDAMTRPYQAAIGRWRAAEAYVEAGDRGAAQDAASSALATARRLGSDWLAREIATLGERARLELAEGAVPSPARSQAEVAPADPFALTPRERQVLVLIAEGATNRQIGAALYMAEKTASVHVSRILSKLGVHSRTQAAAVAHRLHLA